MSILVSDKYTKPLNTQVDFIRPELTEVLVKYDTIRDCLKGQAHINSLGDKYLPIPGGEITDKGGNRGYDMKRYNAYIMRSNFINATGLTLRTVIGKLFSKRPTIELPQAMKPLLDNVNGEGLAFDQLIEKTVAETFAFGRCGLYADFKNVVLDTISIADTADLYPTLSFVGAEDIINWRIDKYRKRLTMVVIREYYEQYDGFAVVIKPQYRTFVLEDGQLVIRVYKEREIGDARVGVNLVNDDTFEITEEYRPLLPGGVPWDVIPFVIIGATDNDWSIDEAPLYQIANMDLSLRRNSADLEEMVHLVGQVTPYVSGIDEQWAEDMGISDMKFGSGHFIPLPDSQSSVGLLQANSSTMLQVAMQDKMQILRHFGAIVSLDTLAQDQTATGAVFQALQIHAPLVTAARNVTEAVTKAIGHAAMFLGIDPEDNDDINIKLNSDILDNPLGVTGLQLVRDLYKDGLIALDEAREQIKVQGLSLHDDVEEFKEVLDQEGLGDLPLDTPLINNDMPVENELSEAQDDDAPTVGFNNAAN